MNTVSQISFDVKYDDHKKIKQIIFIIENIINTTNGLKCIGSGSEDMTEQYKDWFESKEKI